MRHISLLELREAVENIISNTINELVKISWETFYIKCCHKYDEHYCPISCVIPLRSFHLLKSEKNVYKNIHNIERYCMPTVTFCLNVPNYAIAKYAFGYSL